MAHQIGFYQMVGDNTGLIGRDAGGFKDGIAKRAERGVLNRWHDCSSFYLRWVG
jgi:hypothetical protein